MQYFNVNFTNSGVSQKRYVGACPKIYIFMNYDTSTKASKWEDEITNLTLLPLLPLYHYTRSKFSLQVG